VAANALVAPFGFWTPLRRKLPIAWISALIASVVIVLAPAVWNGFPFMFYDTGAFIDLAMQGGFSPERSAFYALFLSSFWPHLSLWPAMVGQVTITVLVMAEFARIVLAGLSPWRFFAIVVVLCVVTGLPWHAAEVLPDILASLMVLCLYLLGFHAAELTLPRKIGLIAVAVLGLTAHASHMGLAAGLVIAIAAIQAATRRVPATAARACWRLPALVFAISLVALVGSNFLRTGDVFVSRAGPAFVLGRLIQDGIAQRLLDDTCPQSGYRLCPYKDNLPKTANDFLWGDSPFDELGGFAGTNDEAKRILADSLKRYPLLHLKMAILNTLEQLVTFETGDGIEPLNDIPVPAMMRHMPDQLDDYNASRQQQDGIDFDWINALHIPVGGLSIAALGTILISAVRQRLWSDRFFLPFFLLIALLGNAFICGALSNPHDRYQSRLMWPASFAVILLGVPTIRRLGRNEPDRGTQPFLP
jgi:hypothetical protein